MVIASGVSAVYLDLEGFDCLSKLSKVQRSEIIVENLPDLERNCFITNSYVYSLFGVIIGVILIVICYTRYRRWPYKENKRWTR